MAITDYLPWKRGPRSEVDFYRGAPLDALQREMNRMLEDFGQRFEMGSWLDLGWGRPFVPQVDLQETDDEIRVIADVPGLEAKDFEVNVAEDVLTLRGERRSEREEKGRVHRIERHYGAFERRVELPCEVQADRARAEYSNGVLKITLPKSPDAQRRVRRIEVKAH